MLHQGHIPLRAGHMNFCLMEQPSSPGISISFIIPNVQFGQELIVKMFDHASGTWQDVPSSINPETGIITAHISHFCCFALFAETVTPESTSASSNPAAQSECTGSDSNEHVRGNDPVGIGPYSEKYPDFYRDYYHRHRNLPARQKAAPGQPDVFVLILFCFL